MSFEPPQVGDKRYDRVMVDEAKVKGRTRSQAEDGAATATSLGQVIIGLLVKRIPRPPRLRPEVRIQDVRLRAYYTVLNENQAFRTALGWLFNNWSAINGALFRRYLRLPKLADRDLDWSYRLWRQRPHWPPELQVGSRRYPGLEGRVTMAKARSLGYRRHPPRLKNRQSLRLGARRLYLRVICDWPDAVISAKEIPEEMGMAPESGSFDTTAVRDVLDRWADGLGIVRPRRNRGRPRAAGQRSF